MIGADMNTYRIAVLAGDGIGPEVLAEGIKVLHAVAALDGSFAFEFTHFPWGCDYYLEHGCMMPEDGIEGTVRHLMDTLAACGLSFDGQGTVTYYESGRLVTDPEKLARFARLHARLDALAQ